jgi:alkylhydroperoxidase/carboxymuconolactone decarboxylase family protein YurZ
MSKDLGSLADDVVQGIGLLHHATPEALKGFGNLGMAATATRALDSKTKELMVLAIGIAVHCDGYVAHQIRAALQHGVTRDEVADTEAFALYMGGSPTAVYDADALCAYDEFRREGRG